MSLYVVLYFVIISYCYETVSIIGLGVKSEKTFNIILNKYFFAILKRVEYNIIISLNTILRDLLFTTVDFFNYIE